MISVHNRKRETMQPGDVYIGRGSMWGNPFVGSGKTSTHDVVRVASVEESIERYREYIQDRIYREPAMQAGIEALARKHDRDGVLRLFCYCTPAPCHGDVLKAIIEGWPR